MEGWDSKREYAMMIYGMGSLSESDNAVTPELLLHWAKTLGSFGMECILVHSEHKFKSMGQNNMDLVSVWFTIILFEGGWRRGV